jgi:uncharacterized protein (TIGR03000 family)
MRNITPTPGAGLSRRLLGVALLLALSLAACPGQAPAAQGEATVRLTVKLPADARLTIDDHLTKQTGAVRYFESPPLPPGRTYTYTLKASWTDKGEARSAERRVRVEPGKQYTIDFFRPDPEEKKVVTKPGNEAQCVAVAGALLARDEAKHWHAVKAGEPVPAGQLLVALPEAELLSKNGAVKVVMLADVGQRGPLPVLEAAVRLHDNPDYDLDISVERGIVGFMNLKKEGAARVRVRASEASAELALKTPGTKVGVEIFGRHPPGCSTGAQIKEDRPTIYVVMLVREGEATLSNDKHTIALRAPPGPALLMWDNLEKKVDVQHLDKLPPSLLPTGEAEMKLFKAVSAATQPLMDGKIEPALKKLLASADPLERIVGVTGAGALDAVPLVLASLADAKHGDVRDHAIIVLRNWLGRGPGQIKALMAELRKDGKYNEAQAKTYLQLLFGFDDEERMRADTYEVLIDLLRHSKLPVRELARWHLVRLVPAGKDIVYDAAAPEAERQRGYEQWRALVPPGKLPPAPKKTQNK